MISRGRRRFLKLATATAGATVAAQIFPPAIRQALATMPARVTGTLQDVQHVVILMQENRSFDHYFGSMRGVRGFGDPRPLSLRNGRPVWFQPDPKGGRDYVLPFHFDSTRTSAECIDQLNHDWRGPFEAWKYHDAWVAQKSPLCMGYFTRKDLPFYYALADAFTICDGYHSSLFGPTNPNRLHLFSGTSGVSVGNDGKQVIHNHDDNNWVADMSLDDPTFKGLAWTTYAERLQQAGVSWKVYQEYDNFGDNLLQSFANFRDLDQDDPLYQRGRAWAEGSTAENAKITNGEPLVNAFAHDVASGRLPQVSWIVAPYMLCEHPKGLPRDGGQPGYGESLTSRLLEALSAHPQVWSKTVFLIMYDENDGFFDHVPPPMPALHSAMGRSTVDVSAENYHGESLGLGPRVPMLAISPWSRGGWVNSQVFDHTSVIRFLEARFGVHEPNISAWRRTVAGDLTSLFDFAGTADTAWPTLPDTRDVMASSLASCKFASPEVPSLQALPIQEPGQRPARPLPYLQLEMRNRGEVGVALNVYPAAGESGPWFYTIGAGEQLQDELPATTRTGGGYDLHVHGPNGFLRHFAGSPHEPVLDVAQRYDTDSGQLVVSVHNRSERACTVALHADTYGPTETHRLQLAAGASGDVAWAIAEHAHWYDIRLDSSSAPSWRRRLAGHIETGRASLSDPAIAKAAEPSGRELGSTLHES